MSGARAGEQEPAVVGPSRRRRVLIASGVVAVLLVVLVGATVTGDFFSAFPRGSCKGVGYGLPIESDPSAAGAPAGFATPEAALAAFAPVAPALGPHPVPPDGWEQYRGRWVRDLGDGTFYEVDVYEGPTGWTVDGDVMICGR